MEYGKIVPPEPPRTPYAKLPVAVLTDVPETPVDPLEPFIVVNKLEPTTLAAEATDGELLASAPKEIQ